MLLNKSRVIGAARADAMGEFAALLRRVLAGIIELCNRSSVTPLLLE